MYCSNLSFSKGGNLTVLVQSELKLSNFLNLLYEERHLVGFQSQKELSLALLNQSHHPYKYSPQAELLR